MTNVDTGTRNTLGYMQRHKIHMFLLTVAKRGEDGLCEYEDGWNDTRVAAHMSGVLGTMVVPANVANLRRADTDNLGELRIVSTRAVTPPENDTVEALRKVIAAMQDSMRDVQHALARALTQLDDVTAENRKILKRMERMDGHHQGIYERLYAIEQKLGIEPPARHETALGEGLLGLPFMRKVAAE